MKTNLKWIGSDHRPPHAVPRMNMDRAGTFAFCLTKIIPFGVPPLGCGIQGTAEHDTFSEETLKNEIAKIC